MIIFFKKNKADYSYLPKRFWLDKDLTKTELEAQRKRHLWQKVLPGADFIEILDNNFTPFVKEYDFRRRKNNFYKHEPPFIYAIGIQKDKYGGKCSLNIGIHLDYCPQPIDNQ